jgi:ATP-dependent RNA helicase HrpB
MKLPVDDLLPEIVTALRNSKSLVIEAPPGAGKTTRVPPALLALGLGEVLVLEPRRIAARMAARRVASEMRERVGETVGYQVRFEDVTGPRTRLRFLTEGVLTRRLMSNPRLKGVGVVVLDEFHERHLDTDLALALVKRLDVKVVVMSATLDAAPIAKFLGGCSVMRSEGKLHDLHIEYTPHSAASLEDQVTSAIERLMKGGLDGDVLVFLPGAAEIRRAARAVERFGLLVTPLHGDLSPAEQDLAVTRSDRRKIILSTNVAESSITIDGVTAVIDSGLARVAVDSPWTGLPSLNVQRISQASATQRAGRAGRTGPGRVIRLYTAEDFHRRPTADAPEILRRELSQVVLQLRAMRVDQIEWLTQPPEAALNAANALLDRLGVTRESTAEMANLPLAPRLAKLVTHAKRDTPESACAVAAILSAGERGSPDLFALIDAEWSPQTRRVYDQLRRLIPGKDRAGHDRLAESILASFPDRVARRRKDDEVSLSSGGSAKFPGCHDEFLIVLDIEERREHGLPLVRLAVAIEPEILVEHATERITLEWNRQAERVEQVTALVYDQLVIEERRAPAEPSAAAARLLYERALEVDIGRFVDREELAQLKNRAAFAGIEIDIDAALERLCEGCAALAEITAAGLLKSLQPKNLNQFAPERLRLPGGREVKVHYDPGKPPWIESRLQDFFGVRETPRIGNTPVVVHLLAPNHRPVQVTSDLAGFWERLYPQVRRELSRRYPKHKWPEKP